MNKLTEKQKRVLEIIKKAQVPPTLHELGKEMGITYTGANQHVQALIKKGFLLRDQNKARALYVIK